MVAIRKIDEESYSAVAHFMSEIKPEWWEFEGRVNNYKTIQYNACKTCWLVFTGGF